MPEKDLVAFQGVEDPTRRNIALWVLGTYGTLIVIVLLWGWLLIQKPVDEVLKVLTTLSAIVSGIVGAIIGFYFREKKN